MRRLLVVLVFVAIVVVAGWTWSAPCRDGGGGAPELAPPTGNPEYGPQEELAHRYAPVLNIPQQSAICRSDGEPMDPAPVDIVLDNPRVYLYGPDRRVITESPGADDLYAGGPGQYLDFPGSPLSGGCRFELDYRLLRQDHPAVTYARVIGDDQHEGVVLQYWFFYYANDWNNRHEGDWETIQLVFDADNAEEALDHAPDRVSYSQHGGAERVTWAGGRVETVGRRPVAYVARGSHAKHFSPNVYLGKGEPGTGFGCDDATGPHRRVDPEVRMMPRGPIAPDGEFAWLSFAGGWGERPGGHNNGPTGPVMKPQFHNPLVWESGHRDESLAVPGSEIFDNQGVSFFCVAAAFGSNVFASFASAPVVTGAAVGLAGGAVVTVALALVLAVVRSGSANLYGPRSLREPRTLGQIIRASAHLYRLHWYPLLGLALIVVPLGLVLAAVQELVPPIPYLSVMFELANDRGLSAVATVLYGYGVNLPVFAVVTGGVAAAMRQVEAGHDPSPLACYRLMARYAGRLAFARLRALVIVLLLFVSGIGIPLAIYFVVRWMFIEQAIVLSGAPAREAAARSASLVYGHWWRTAFIVVVLGAIGGFFAPLLVTALILWTPLPLGFINVVSGVAFAALLPFIGIMFTVLYWDMSARYARAVGLDFESAPA